MSTERKGVEFFVGLFLLIGFAVIATMVVVFGRVGQGMQKNYKLTVEFPNASGLVKGSDVLLAGARVGFVTQAPRLTGKGYTVATDLLIRNDVQIPRESRFSIRSSGLMGDSYVDILPPPTFDPNDFFRDKETAIGQRTGGIDDLTAKGGEMMDTLNTEVLKKVSATLDEIKVTTANLDENFAKLFSEKNLKNIEETFANFKTTSQGFSKTAHDLDVMVGRTQEIVDSAKGTMKTVDGAAGDLRLTLGDFRKTADSARSLFSKATTGEGALGTLISDKKTAEDLKALISNMRRSGVVFYKNRPVEPTPAATPAPKRR